MFYRIKIVLFQAAPEENKITIGVRLNINILIICFFALILLSFILLFFRKIGVQIRK